jgi:hypothetical protein
MCAWKPGGLSHDHMRHASDVPHHRWQIKMLIISFVLLLSPILIRSAKLPSGCLFKEIVGIECPACGVTRSLEALMRGDIVASFLFNPAGVLVGMALLVSMSYFCVAVFAKSEAFPSWEKESRVYSRVEMSLFFTLFVFWAGKLLIL